MTQRFDELSRAMAGSTSRRSMLKLFGVAAVSATAATVLKPFRADATCTAGQTPCGTGCCPAGLSCLKPSTVTCGCPAGQVKCGSGASACCTGTCSDPATNCCCAAGTTPCGSSCCKGGVACIDRTNGLCGCPSGYASCGTAANRTCCPAGKACGDPACVSPTTLGSKVKTCATQACNTCTAACQNATDCMSSGGSCNCWQKADQTGCFCGVFVGTCGETALCPNGQTDCPTGQTCIGTCCGNICAPPCGTPLAVADTTGFPRTTP